MSMELEKLNEWNPWWENPELVKILSGKDRPRYEELIKSIEIKEVTIITGIRRSGKSTLMYQMIQKLLNKGISPKQIMLVNFEDKKLNEDSIEDIYRTYRENLNPDKKAFVFFDEIHKREGWESWIRKKYDLKSNDKFIISGSSSYLLKKEYSNLLTGRNLTFEVYPLSFEEFLGFKEIIIDKLNIKKNILLDKTKSFVIKSLKEYLSLGGFPEIILKQEEFKIRVLEQYFDDILYKDIIDRHKVNSQKIRDFAIYLATHFTGILSLRNIRNSLSLSYDAINDYLSYFKEAFLFFNVDHFSYSYKEQKTLASKIYCIDNGIRNSVSFKFSKDEGKLAENIVFIELKRRKENPYYWKSRGEVDFVLKNNDEDLTAINVTYTDDINKRETESLMEIKKAYKNVIRCVIITKDTAKKENGIEYIPLWKWLLVDP